MKKEQPLREHVVYLLKGEGAHADFETTVKELPSHLQRKRPLGLPHSPWELLEHLRIAQWDILEFTRDPKHVSPEWPSGYWPTSPEPPDSHAWGKSVAAFRASLDAMIALVQDESTELIAPLPHDPEKTVLREALLLADHNAYHLGQLVLVRRLLGAWG
jgi:predicted RNase H-like HicB family nuclease